VVAVMAGGEPGERGPRDDGGWEVRTRLAKVVGRGLLARGIQVSASRQGRQVDLALGETSGGEPLRVQTVVGLGEGALPALGVGAGLLVQDGRLHWDAPVGGRDGAGWGLRDVLAGASDRWWAARADEEVSTALADGHAPAGGAGWAAVWGLLARAAGAGSEAEARRWFETVVARPWCGGELWPSADGVPPGRAVGWEEAPAGPVGTARALQRLYRCLLGVLAGQHPGPLARGTLVRAMLAPPAGAAPPARGGGPGAGAGMVSGWRLRAAGVVSPLAFGCQDRAGTVVGLADPVVDLALAVVLVGPCAAERALAGLRDGVVRALYDELVEDGSASGRTSTLPTAPASTALWASATWSRA
jgi:hypothetical protein